MEFQNDTWISNSLMQTAGLDAQSLPEGTLYIVGLPIGNMGDITLRALWTLAKSNRIAAEDTRETRKLLDKFGVSVPLVSVREHNEHEGAEVLIEALGQGERVSLVTDAGTPCVSDPGAKVVALVREAGYRVVPVPGASAVVTALSAAGLEGRGFSFVGFVPPQAKGRRKALAYWANRPEPFVLYEAPHRVVDLLKDLASALRPERRVVVAREVTKKFETFTALTAGTLAAWADEHTPRGEYVVLVDEDASGGDGLTDEARAWLEVLKPLLPASKLAAAAAKATGLPRDTVYRMLCGGE